MKILSALVGFLFPTATTDPSSSVEGQAYYNSSTHVLKIHNGTAFVEVGGSSGGLTDEELGMMNSMGGMY